jgi:hypothetical protein
MPDGRKHFKHFDPLTVTMEEMMALRRESFGLRAELEEANYQRAKAEKALSVIMSSKTWRTGRVVLSPARLVRKYFNRLRRKP